MQRVRTTISRPPDNFSNQYINPLLPEYGQKWTAHGEAALWVPAEREDFSGRFPGRYKYYTTKNLSSMKFLFKHWDLLQSINPACLVDWLQYPQQLKLLCASRGKAGIRLYIDITNAARKLPLDNYWKTQHPDVRPRKCRNANVPEEEEEEKEEEEGKGIELKQEEEGEAEEAEEPYEEEANELREADIQREEDERLAEESRKRKEHRAVNEGSSLEELPE